MNITTDADPLRVPAAHGEPPVRGRLRGAPEDFVVEELLGFEPDGAGTHALLVVEKRGANTAWVGSQLARAALSTRKPSPANSRQASTGAWTGHGSV